MARFFGGTLLFLLPVLIVASFQWFFFRLFIRGDELSARSRSMAVLWGMVGAILISVAIQLSIEQPVANANLPKDASLLLRGAIWGPFWEEVAKGIAPLAAWLIWGVRGRRKLLVIGALSGTGFFITEDVLALIGAALQGGNAYAYNLVMRVCVLAGEHSGYAGLCGLAIGCASTARSKALKVLLPMVGLLIAFSLHGWGNTLALAIGAGHAREGWELTFSMYLKLILVYWILLAIARIRIARGRNHIPMAHRPPPAVPASSFNG